MLLKDFINSSRERLLEVYPEAEAKNLIVMLTEDLLGAKSYTHIIHPETEVTPALLSPAQSAVDRMVAGEPIQYILGHAHFCSHEFLVNPSVLIPRQETEILVNLTLEEAGRRMRLRKAFGKSASPVRILDMCTGSGCIAWSVALGLPGVEVTAVDISDEALEVAKKQPFKKQQLNELGAKAPQFLKMDVLDLEQPVNMEPFDIIVSNPPYVRESEKARMQKNVLEHEPELALFVPDDDALRYYKALKEWSRRLLLPGGVIIMEINEALGRDTAALFRDNSYDKVDILDDLYGKNRFVRYTNTPESQK